MLAGKQPRAATVTGASRGAMPLVTKLQTAGKTVESGGAAVRWLAIEECCRLSPTNARLLPARRQASVVIRSAERYRTLVRMRAGWWWWAGER